MIFSVATARGATSSLNNSWRMRSAESSFRPFRTERRRQTRPYRARPFP